MAHILLRPWIVLVLGLICSLVAVAATRDGQVLLHLSEGFGWSEPAGTHPSF